MSKDTSKPSKTGALVVALMVLWLAGLTALVLVNLQKPAAGDLDTRVANLETKANSLVGRIHPPGDKELNNLEDRLIDLEKRIADFTSGDAMPVTAETGGCDCQRLENRLAALETAVDSEPGSTILSGVRGGQAPDTGTQPQAGETASQTAAQNRSDGPEKGTRPERKTAAKAKSKTAAGKTLPMQQPRIPKEGDEASRSNPDYGSRNLHDMNRRYVPIYQGASNEAGSRGLLGPGSGGYR